VGERYSIADIALYAYTHVADEGGFDLARYPAVRAGGGYCRTVSMFQSIHMSFHALTGC